MGFGSHGLLPWVRTKKVGEKKPLGGASGCLMIRYFFRYVQISLPPQALENQK
jgi:hypothetical protein